MLLASADQWVDQLEPHWDFVERGYLRCIKMRPEGRILSSGGVDEEVLPETPRTAHVVAQRHRNQREERKESSANRHLDEIRLVLHVHEEQDDDDRLDRRNRQSDNGIQDAEIDERRTDGNRGEGQKRSKDDDVRLWTDDMMFGV